jgi:peptidoglycan/xylan/chitin deacetylase (PgdA/CDA1 family)
MRGEVGRFRSITVFLLCIASACAGLVAGCGGSSRGEIANLPTYSASGRIVDSDGVGLAGLELSLGDRTVTTSADGGFNFTKLPRAFTGELAPTSAELSFIPGTRNINVTNTDISELNFTGFALAGLDHDLPESAQAGKPFIVRLRAVDNAGTDLAGYTTGTGDIASDPTGLVAVELPQFTDGVATVQVRFDTPGEYTIYVYGYCAKVDGVLGVVNVGPEQKLPHGLRFEKWQGGAEAAVSLTFDDGSADHWSRGLPLWKEYGFHVTLGIMANKFIGKPERIAQLQEAFDAGHELANHTSTHPDITTVPLETAIADIDTCQQLLLDNVQGLDRVLTFVYPYEQFDSLTIAMLQEQGFLFARSGTQDMVEVTALNDGYNPPWFHLYSWADLNMMPLEMWDDTVDTALTEGSWLIEQCHGIGVAGEPGVGWSPRPESEYREHYDHIKSYGERLWIAPVSVVGRYIYERNNDWLNVLDDSDGRLAFQIGTGLEQDVYNVPLTVWLNHPAGWNGLRVELDGAKTPYSETEDGRVRINAVPGAGVISVERVD